MSRGTLTIALLLALMASVDDVTAQDCPRDKNCVWVHRIVRGGQSSAKAWLISSDTDSVAIEKGQRIARGNRIRLDPGSPTVVLKAAGRSAGEITLFPRSDYTLIEGSCGDLGLQSTSSDAPDFVGKWTRNDRGFGVARRKRCSVAHHTELILRRDENGNELLFADGCISVSEFDPTTEATWQANYVDKGCGGKALTSADSLDLEGRIQNNALPVTHVSAVALVINESSIRRLTDDAAVAALSATLFTVNHSLGLNFAQRAADWYMRQPWPLQGGMAAASGVGGYFATKAIIDLFNPGSTSTVTVNVKLPP